jgi:hypothetical protein
MGTAATKNFAEWAGFSQRSWVVVVNFFGAGGEFHDPPVWKRGIEVNAGFFPNGFGNGAWDDGVSGPMRRV